MSRICHWPRCSERSPIRIVKIGEEKRLIQPKINEDITDKMNAFTTGFIQALPDVDGYIVKSKSPTIGLRWIKVYAASNNLQCLNEAAGSVLTKSFRRFLDIQWRRMTASEMRRSEITSWVNSSRLLISDGQNIRNPWKHCASSTEKSGFIQVSEHRASH
jgi:hypothetical protein